MRQRACAETEDFIKTFYVEIYIRVQTQAYTHTDRATITPATAAIKPSTAEFHAGIVRFMTHGVGET